MNEKIYDILAVLIEKAASNPDALLEDIKGKPGKDGRGIKNIRVNSDYELIVRFDDGETINAGKLPKGERGESIVGPKGEVGQVIKGDPGVDGLPGKNGTSVRDIVVSADGDLIFTLDDGTRINAGKIPEAKGGGAKRWGGGGTTKVYVDAAIAAAIEGLGTVYVPYTGATENVNLGSFSLTAKTAALNPTNADGLVITLTDTDQTKFPIRIIGAGPESNSLLSFENDLGNIGYFGVNPSNHPTNPGDFFMWTAATRSIRFGTDDTERLKLTEAGLLRVNNLTANTLVSSDADKALVSLATATYPSLTEISYVKGVTSPIQTQINAISSGYVPYTGATNDVNLGTHGLTATDILINGNPAEVCFSIESEIFDNLVNNAFNCSPTFSIGAGVSSDVRPVIFSPLVLAANGETYDNVIGIGQQITFVGTGTGTATSIAGATETVVVTKDSGAAFPSVVTRKIFIPGAFSPTTSAIGLLIDSEFSSSTLDEAIALKVKVPTYGTSKITAILGDTADAKVGVGTTSPGYMLQVGEGEISSTSLFVHGYISGAGVDGFATTQNRVKLNLASSGAGSSASTADFAFSDGSTFRASEDDVAGTNDVFFQGLSGSGTSGYTILEAYNCAGLILGTGGNSNPVQIRVNRSEVARFADADGYLQIIAGTGTVAPIKLTTGTDLGTAQEGCFEFGSSRLAFTPAGTTRKRFSLFTDATPATNQTLVGNGTDFTLTATPTFDQLTLNGAGSTTVGQLTFSGSTQDWIDFGTNGVGAPTLTTRSAGTKIVYRKNLNSIQVDYAMGIESNTLWFSVPTTSPHRFKWYGSTTLAATLTGLGDFTAVGDVAGNTVTSSGTVTGTTFRGTAATNQIYLGANLGTSTIISSVQAAALQIGTIRDFGADFVFPQATAAQDCFLTTVGATNVTLPTSGTLTTLPTVVSALAAFTTLTDAGTVAIDLSLGPNFNLNIAGNRTLGVPTNIVAGQSGKINIRQDITGSRTLAYSWPYMFAGGGTGTALSTGKLVLDTLRYSVNHYSTATVTITIAAPGVVTWTAHGLTSGMKMRFTTTGALPGALAINTSYWITVVDANTFKLSASFANAQTAAFITTTGTQSGVHTAITCSIEIRYSLNVNSTI